MKTLTIFTPTYNRRHTIGRVFESLCRQKCKDFDWLIIDDGSTDQTQEIIADFIKREDLGFDITYYYKENGGLYTGYNEAYRIIETELSMCIDSDDCLAEDAVEKIVNCWRVKGSDKYAGLIGLDRNIKTGKPIGGWFPKNLHEVFFPELLIKKIHFGDTKEVMRTDLMKEVAPMIGFPGEKNFNPNYMQWQVCDRYPSLVLNEVLCEVEYQEVDSMSAGIWRQYYNSPRSFAKGRILEMTLVHSTWIYRLKAAVHYVSSCLLAKDSDWLKNSPKKFMTICMAPLGILLWLVVLYKNK